VLSALLWKTVYNVYFRHRGIPSKFWLSATDWAFWKEIQTGTPYKLIEKLHAELGIRASYPMLTQTGDVVRIQPNHICFNDIHAFEEIYGPTTKTRKGGFYAMVGGKPGNPASIFTETYLNAEVP